MRGPARLLPLALLLVALLPRTAPAYSIGTSVTPPCHELITLEALEAALPDLPPSSLRPLQGEAWAAVRATLEAELRIDRFPHASRDLAAVLVTGVRSPDVGGVASLDLHEVRGRHLDPELQHPHSLRRKEDDGLDGDRIAAETAREWILELSRTAEKRMRDRPEAQIVHTEVWLDFRGLVTVDTWGPGHHLGEALHTLQDSFSHTVRSNDFRRIRRVLNFLESVSGDYDPARDGLPHSSRMDECSDDTRALVLAAREASLELMLAWWNGSEEVEKVLDRWMGIEPPCLDPLECPSHWETVIRAEADAAGARSCSATGATAVLVPVLLLGSILRRWRARGSGIALILVCAVLVGSSVMGCRIQPTPYTPPLLEACLLQPEQESCAEHMQGFWSASVHCEFERTPFPFGECEGTVVHSLLPVGTLLLLGDGRMQNDVSVRIRRRLILPLTCLQGERTCADLQPDFGNHRCAELEGVCVCNSPDEPVPFGPAAGSWEVSDGGTLLLLDEEGDVGFEGPACVGFPGLLVEVQIGEQRSNLIFR